MYTDNPQEKEDFAKIISKDRESESTEVDPNLLLSFLSPSLKAICSHLLSNYPEMMGDTDRWTLSLKGFMLGQTGFVVSQLQSKGKKDSLTLSFDELIFTIGDAEGKGFNVEWLKNRVIALRDLKEVGPSIHASLSLLQ